MSRYAFIGGTYRGYKLIESLVSNGHIPSFSIVLKEDEHEEIKYFNKISELLNKNKIPHSIKRKLSNEDYDLIKKSDLDFVLIFCWRTLIDPSINQFMKFGAVAVHHSLLPLYRGFAPTHWAIINGENETGVTLFLINDGEIDSGQIISQKKIPILFEDYVWDLNERAIQCTEEIILEFFKNYKSKNITLINQDESKATYCCKRTPEDGKIIWTKNSTEVYNLIRGIAYPFAGAFCEYESNKFHIRKARIGKSNEKNFTGRIPGRLINIDSTGIEVLCGEGTLEILQWEDKMNKIVSNPSADINTITATLK